ncbi:hypothetical protein JD844_012343 [Phrynosoma platyrhinos]|uniref:LSM11, U7 small nuclear RNA associated n=1 Tax=Phrynosoma platyrhinos TaxID=52577 RepID=A0ABQ7TJN9_PHRPL|nr:hypothetical protein JD844_012343 [Phrynosoma platyrhinos]
MEEAAAAAEEAEEAVAGPRPPRRRRCSRSPSPGLLDVSSPRFDPLLALYSERTPLPCPAAPCFNNLAEYESFQRGLLRGGRQRGAAAGRRSSSSNSSSSGGRRGARSRARADPERIERLRSLMVVKEAEAGAKEEAAAAAAGRARARGRREPRNQFVCIPVHEGSPLGELHRCVRDGVKVNVHIRTFKGLRGVCTGFLVAFDKFWNMVMIIVLFLLKLQESLFKKGTDSKMTKDLPTLPCNPRTLGRKSESSRGRSEEYRTKRHTSKERTRSSSLPRASGKEADWPGRVSQTEGKNAGGPRGRSRKKQRSKVDYQQVFTRHINQIFIRGENVLLVHLAH